MLSFSEFLDEARRNPELNPKVGTLEQLEPYKDREDMAISYVADVGNMKPIEDPEGGKGGVTFELRKKIEKRKKFEKRENRNVSGFKIGINPRSTYNTPNGVYVYPLKEAMKLYARPNRGILKVPFAGENPLIYLLQYTNAPGFKVQELSDYNSKDFDQDFMKLGQIITKFFKKNRVSEAYGWEYAKAVLDAAMKDAKNKTPGGQFWNMTRYTFFTLLRFKKGSYFQNDSFKPEYKEEIFAMMKDPNAKADWGDMTIRFTKPTLTSNTNTKSSNIWTNIFLQLGYGGITDKKGQGIIHSSEPMQGVFFSPKAYKVVKSFYNKGYMDGKPIPEMTVPDERFVEFKAGPGKPMKGSLMTAVQFAQALAEINGAQGIFPPMALLKIINAGINYHNMKNPVIMKDRKWNWIEAAGSKKAKDPYLVKDSDGESYPSEEVDSNLHGYWMIGISDGEYNSQEIIIGSEAIIIDNVTTAEEGYVRTTWKDISDGDKVKTFLDKLKP